MKNLVYFSESLKTEIHKAVGEEPQYNIGSPRETYKVNKELDKQVDELTRQFEQIGPLTGGAPAKLLLFNVNVDSVGDKDGLIQRVINAYIKVFKFNAGEDITKETIDAELLKIKGLLDVKFKSSDFTDVDTLYLFIILSAYITAAEEYIRPEAAFKTNGWWFFDKEHFEKIVGVLNLEKILEKYNQAKPELVPLPAAIAEAAPAAIAEAAVVAVPSAITEAAPAPVPDIPPLAPPLFAVVPENMENLPRPPNKEGGNKTHRFRYKTQSGKHTRSARW